MNKKGYSAIDSFEIYGWAIFVILITLVITYSLSLRWYSYESFTIYKIECKNEPWIWHQRITIITDNLDYEEELKEEFLKVKLEKNIPNATLNVDSIKTFLIENGSFQITGNIDYLSSEEICEQKEVNETIINYEIQITCEISAKYCDNYIPYPVVITANGSNIEDISMEGCKGNCRKEVISTAVQVKDLTRKWLNKNTECIEYTCLGKECKKGSCYIYKSGDYKIEVKQ